MAENVNHSDSSDAIAKAKELLELEAKATPAPWIDEGMYLSGAVRGGRPNGEVIIRHDPNRLMPIAEICGNRDFIAFARNNAPAIASELIALSTQRDEAVAKLDKVRAAIAQRHAEYEARKHGGVADGDCIDRIIAALSGGGTEEAT